MQQTVEEARLALRAALAGASRGLVEREALVETIALAAVAREHVLVIGPPGTAKSEAVRRVAGAIQGRTFEYLLGRFTEPSEIFGPVDIRKLKEGLVETETAGMLPEAEIAFLDEVFQGSTAILNTLLGILNERTFRRGHTRMRCPLRICVGASNRLPSDESLAAFGDRFLARVFLDPIPDPRLEELLEGGWQSGSNGATPSGFPPTPSGVSPRDDGAPTGSVAQLDVLAAAAERVDLGRVRPYLAEAIRLLRRAGIQLSDRRAVRTQRLLAAAAVFGGRSAASGADLWPLVLAVPAREEQAVARETLRDLLAEAENAALPVAAEEASAGPRARAARLLAAGTALLEARPAADAADDVAMWRLKLEGVARELDASLAREALPPELAALRARLVAELAAPPP